MPRKKKARRGRPPIDPAARRTISLAVRFRESELKLIRKAGGDKPTVWCRKVLLAAAKRALK